jgi:DNA-binding Xre family transcriptional regulator
MNPVQELSRTVETHFPTAELKMDPAETTTGSWFLDISTGAYQLNVEWRPDRGFGLTSSPEPGYGAGADESYNELGTATRRVLWLLEHRSPTVPPLSLRLRELRAARRVTQEELARRLGVKQASISKFESRGESVTLRKLQEFFAALGGQLSLHISFEDGDVDFPLEQLHTGASS